MSRTVFLLAIAVLLPVVLPGESAVDQALRGIESLADGGWRRMEFSRTPPTVYDLVEEGEESDVALRAHSIRGAALLWRPFEVEPGERMEMAWRWRVSSTVAGAELAERRADDAAARVYVGFRYSPELVPRWQRLKYALAKLRFGQMPPYGALCYVWADEEPPGTRLVSPHYERLRVVVLRDRTGPVGEWAEERVDIGAEFERQFGFEAPPVSHVAVMTDGDDTGAGVTAWYADLRVETGEAEDAER